VKIGYCVEGSTDEALLEGLRRRWCPHATLEKGQFRGTTGQSQRREIPKICFELQSKGVNLIVFLRDANNEAWRDVLKADTARCPGIYTYLAVFAVCDRNVECWLCSDAGWLASQFHCEAAEFRVDDPKRRFQRIIGVTALDRKHEEIATLVKEAPLYRWLQNKSFEQFYDSLWQKSKELGCEIENLRQRSSH